jgi:hypothetical protein
LCAPKSTHGGCFWKPIFKALAQLIPALIKIAVVTLATFACGTCAILISGVVSSVMVAVTGGRCLRRSVISSRRPARPESIPDQQLGILAAAAARENHVAHEGDGLRPGPGPRRIDKM